VFKKYCLGTCVRIPIEWLRYGVDYQGIVVRYTAGGEIFLFSHLQNWFMGPTHPPVWYVPGGLSWGLKHRGPEVDRTLLSSAEVKSVWRFLYIFMAWPIFITTAAFAINSRWLGVTKSQIRHSEIVCTPTAQFLVYVLQNKLRLPWIKVGLWNSRISLRLCLQLQRKIV
jgi:hypothetical protein